MAVIVVVIAVVVVIFASLSLIVFTTRGTGIFLCSNKGEFCLHRNPLSNHPLFL